MTEPARRTFLGRDASWAERVRVYRTDEALEVAYINTFEVSLRRLFFDEVQLVTLHRVRGSRTLWLLIVLSALWALGTLVAGPGSDLFYGFVTGTAIVFALTLVTALIRSSVVTAYGARARARIRFVYRAGKARRVYDDLCRRVGEVQGRIAAEAAAAAGASARPLEESFPEPPQLPETPELPGAPEAPEAPEPHEAPEPPVS
jgi:hypothetical protein